MQQANNQGSVTGDAIILTATGKGRFQVEARSGTQSFLIDEPVKVGGLGEGPNPYDLLSAAMGACTLMTLRLYAERKGWPLTDVRVRVTHSRDALASKDFFARDILLGGSLSDEQKTKLMEIADRCPVHLTLERGSNVVSTMIKDAATFDGIAAPDCQHKPGMEEACA